MLKMTAILRVGKDAEVKEFSGKTVINFSGASTTKTKDGDKTTWVDCAYWTDKTGIAPYLLKGTQVYVEGTPEVRQYPKNDGTTGVSLTLRVGMVQLLGSKSSNEAPVEQEPAKSMPISRANPVPVEDLDSLPF